MKPIVLIVFFLFSFQTLAKTESTVSRLDDNQQSTTDLFSYCEEVAEVYHRQTIKLEQLRQKEMDSLVNDRLSLLQRGLMALKIDASGISDSERNELENKSRQQAITKNPELFQALQNNLDDFENNCQNSVNRNCDINSYPTGESSCAPRW